MTSGQFGHIDVSGTNAPTTYVGALLESGSTTPTHFLFTNGWNTDGNSDIVNAFTDGSFDINATTDIELQVNPPSLGSGESIEIKTSATSHFKNKFIATLFINITPKPSSEITKSNSTVSLAAINPIGANGTYQLLATVSTPVLITNTNVNQLTTSFAPIITNITFSTSSLTMSPESDF